MPLWSVAFHNGGMDTKNRWLVESLFLRTDIVVICTTGTLAVGVNLPAHLVVLKSTQLLYVYVEGVSFDPWACNLTPTFSHPTCAVPVTRRRDATRNIVDRPFFR